MTRRRSLVVTHPRQLPELHPTAASQSIEILTANRSINFHVQTEREEIDPIVDAPNESFSG